MNITSFQVLADPTRLHIVELLRAREHAVNELVARMAIQQSGVSRHLRILEEAGFVQTRAAGNKRLYALRPERFIELDQWVTQYRRLWMARLDAFGEALEQRQARRVQRRRRSR
ncbi:MAG: metalloregulator ArsR/SmtB family transcription factor [Candidatus Eremiobacteraeota bacterium]|nr:metalloregulator ArsR/SmtB family transcription factor [Candidatus Eremiobacteraeota bacterium]